MASQQVAQLWEMCELISRPALQDLLTQPKWGTVDFLEFKAEIDAIQAAARAVRELPEEALSPRVIGSVHDAIERSAVMISRLEKFFVNPAEPPQQQKDQVGNLIDGAFNAVKTQLAPHLVVFGIVASPGSKLLSKVQSTVEEVQSGKERFNQLVGQSTDGFRKIVETAQEEIKDAVSAAKAAAAQSGVEVHAEAFSDEVKRLEPVSKRWLAAAVVCGVLGVVMALILNWYTPLHPDTNWLIQYGVTRLFVVGSFVASALWCGSVYRALSHQITINRHRCNALRTFQAFATAAHRDEVRDAILLEATRSIFGVTPTGFLNATETNVDGGGRLLEAASKVAKGA